MKKLAAFLFAFISVLTACSNNDNSPAEITLRPVAGLSSANDLTVEADAISATFTVATPEKPSVESPASWLKVSSSAPDASNISTITLSFDANTSNEARSTILSVSARNQRFQVTFTQKGAPEEVTPDPENPSKSYEPWINPDPCEIGGANAREVALSLGVGWNLGNQMDAHANGVADETCWGNPKATQQLFDVLKATGFSTVRIPVTWLGKFGEAPDYKIDQDWLNRVVELVGMAEKAGLNAIVNMHHDGGDSKYWLNIIEAAKNPAKNEEIKAQFAAMWTQIAEAMKDKGNFLMFESFNEIHDGKWGWGDNRSDGGKQYKALNEWNQTFVDAVRATGGNNASRWLGVPSYVTNIDLACDGSMILPTDPAQKVMVAVHFYDPNDFCLTAKASDWGHTGDNAKKGSAIQDEDHIRNQFAKLTNYWVNKNVPVYIGESGPCNNTSDRANTFRTYYLEYIHRAAREAGLALIYWDNGAVGNGEEKFGMFNHANGNILNKSEAAIKAMLTGGTCRDEDYNLSVIYNNAPNF